MGMDSANVDCPSRRNYVRMRIEIDISKPFKKGFKLKREGMEAAKIDFMYERLLGFCFFME